MSKCDRKDQKNGNEASLTGFLSGEALLQERQRDQAFPVWGEKLSEATGSWMEDKQADARLRDVHTLLTEPKFNRRDQLAMGEWLAESKMVRILHETGKFWQYMGAETDIGKCLYPEEAIYLMETGELEVSFGGMPMSVQHAMALMLHDQHHLNCYLVYGHLTRIGCKVVRHQPYLRITRYEKQINLDQHQNIRRGKKLELRKKKNVVNNKENKRTVNKRVETIDLAMEEFYASLGDAACDNQPLTSGKNKDMKVIDLSSDTEEVQEEDLKVVLLIKRERKKAEQKQSELIDSFEQRRREALDAFPCLCGERVIHIKVEDSELLPPNACPQKEFYEISLDLLNYYSKYDEYCNTRNERGNRDWRNEPVRNRSWGSQDARHDNWQRETTRSYSQETSNWRWNGSRGNMTGNRKDANAWFADHDRHGNMSWTSRGAGVEGWRKRKADAELDENAMNDYDRVDFRVPHHHFINQNRSSWRQQDNWSSDSQHSEDGRIGNYCDERGKSDTNFREDKINGSQKAIVDLSRRPEWKTRKRKFQRYQADIYPSSIVQLGKKVSSWREYKKELSEMNAERQLVDGPAKSLWKGPTVPLVNPSAVTSLESALSACVVMCEKLDEETHAGSSAEQLILHYDVYHPHSPYRKSQPTLPDKRVTVVRETSVVSLQQILEVSRRFSDDVPVHSAVVICGEVRLYRLKPFNLPPPQVTR